MTTLKLVAPQPVPVSETDRLWASLTPEFLSAIGWDGDRCAVNLEPGPLFRNHRCPTRNCNRVAAGSDGQACHTCQRRADSLGMAIEEFIPVGVESDLSGREPTGHCDVRGCGRIRIRHRLCVAHDGQRAWRNLSEEAFLASNPEPFESFGDCVVPACLREAQGHNGFCVSHDQRLYDARRADPNLIVDKWAAEQLPSDWDVVVSFRGVPELVRVQVLVGLQKHINDGCSITASGLRTMLRDLQLGRYRDARDAPLPERRRGRDAGLLGRVHDSLRLLTASVDSEVLLDHWDLRVFGLNGFLDFRPITQDWLREATKQWTTEVVGTLRDKWGVVARDVILTCRRLSESLARRPDGGHNPAALERRDMVNHLNELSRLERTEAISRNNRTNLLRNLRRFLGDCRDIGLGQPGRPLFGLSAEFMLLRDDVPQPPRDEDPARDLPDAVMKSLTERLDGLAAQTRPDNRRLAEILMDTGRRPDEICQLPLDCLDTGDDDKWVLIWTNFKANRTNRRLPIHDETAEVIRAQQAAVTARYPDTPRDRLALFPRERDNPDGVFAMSCSTFSAVHRTWVRSFPAIHNIVERLDDGTEVTRHVPFIDDAGQEYALSRITPYAYRHTYCQRHADQGTGPDVLKELLDHRSMETTQTYYRVRDKRLRKAVDRVYASQVTGRGESLWATAAREIDDATRARIRVGEIAVPYGVCTEPSNIKAAGAACPYKFTCIACSHFRSDPSYLPELRAYHDRLLETRLRVRAARDLDDWAKDKVDPADEEIEAVARLVDKLEADATSLTEDDRALLERAVQLVRAARRNVDLGMPGRPTTSDPRAVRTR